MRKWIEITETMATGSKGGAPLAAYFASLKINDFKLVGNMDVTSADIYRRDMDSRSEFVLVIDGKIAAFYGVEVSGEYAELHHMYVDPAFRGQKLTEKFCWFLQTRESKKVMFGDKMSADAFALVRSLAASGRFKLFWIRGDEKERFDPNFEVGTEIEDGHHTAIEGPTGWRLIAENTVYGQQRHFAKLGEWTMADLYDLFADYDDSYRRTDGVKLTKRGLTLSESIEQLSNRAKTQ